MERTSYWITIDEPDGTMMHVTQTLAEAIDYLRPQTNRDFSVERVVEEDVTEAIKLLLG